MAGLHAAHSRVAAAAAWLQLRRGAESRVRRAAGMDGGWDFMP